MEMAKRDAHITSLDQIIAEREKDIASHKSAIEEYEKQIKSLDMEMAKRDARITNLNQIVVERDVELAAARNELHNIYSSKKWKLIMKIAAPVLFIKSGVSKARAWMKKLFIAASLNHYMSLTHRFCKITVCLGLRNAIAKAFSALTRKGFSSIKSSAISRDQQEDALSVPRHLEFVEVLNTLFQRLKLVVDAEKVWELISAHLSPAALYEMQSEAFALDRFLLTANTQPPCELIQASALPQRGQAPRKKNILFITSLFPDPHHGGGARVMDFIKILAENNTVYLYSLYNPFEDCHAYQQAQRYCTKVRKVSFWEPAKNREDIRNWLKDVSIDIVHYEWPESLLNYDLSWGKLHIFTHMEAVSLRLLMDMSREDSLSELWIEKLGKLIHYLKIELVDAAAMNVRVAVTTKDADFFRSLVPGQEYTVLNHGVSTDEFCLPDVDPELNTITFVGNFLHPPNEDAIRFFFDAAWDDILQNIPQAQIYIVGVCPSKWIQRLSRWHNVFVTGKVADVRPYIQKASVCIAPLISGAGLRGKVLQYASLRRTFVATSIAVEDLVLVDGKDYLKAANAKEFSEKVVELLRDKKRARKMGLKAFETVTEHYDNRRLVDYLTRIYNKFDEKVQL